MAGLGMSQSPLGSNAVEYDMGRLRYCTYREEEANGRFPVQVNEMGCYPGPQAMSGIDIFGMDGGCGATYQYKSSDKIGMSC